MKKSVTEEKVSIVMNCYNGEEYIKEAIDSIFSQTYQNWEIIFVDNCSSDNSAKIALSYGERIKYYKTESNIPLFPARNFGLNYVEGSLVAFLDADDIWAPDKLEKQVKLFSNPEVFYAFTGVNYIDSMGRPLLKNRLKLKKGKITQSLLLRNCIALSSAVVRASVFSHKKFSNEYNLLGDYDFWLRISTDFQADFIDEPLLSYRLHESSTTNKNKGKWIFEMRKHYTAFVKEYGFRYPNIIFYIIKCEIGSLMGRY